MQELELINRPIADELRKFSKVLRENIQSDAPLLDKVISYILKTKGKQIRPSLVFLSAKANGELNQSTFNGASLVEIVHTATLVHDDVVDNSDKRRGFFSVKALWKSKVAVLVGDYLLAKGMDLALSNKNYDLLHILNQAIQSMSKGELIQLKKSRTLDIKESEYYTIIGGKTASLFSAACGVGAASVSKDEKVVNNMKDYGMNLGMAYQIKDDLMDFSKNDIGKPLGIDIKEGKMTLPLIHTLKDLPWLKRKKILRIVKAKKNTQDQIDHVIDTVSGNGGLAYAEKQMHHYHDKALLCLDQLDEGECLTSLRALTTFIMNRNK